MGADGEVGEAAFLEEAAVGAALAGERVEVVEVALRGEELAGEVAADGVGEPGVGVEAELGVGLLAIWMQAGRLTDRE